MNLNRNYKKTRDNHQLIKWNNTYKAYEGITTKNASSNEYQSVFEASKTGRWVNWVGNLNYEIRNCAKSDDIDKKSD